MNRMSPEQPGYMPTFDEKGDRSATGSMACLTCHTPHNACSTFDSTSGSGDPAYMFLRGKTHGSFCTDCHGDETLWRFLYYHRGNRDPVAGKNPNKP